MSLPHSQVGLVVSRPQPGHRAPVVLSISAVCTTALPLLLRMNGRGLGGASLVDASAVYDDPSILPACGET